jgi:hypothetical protein
MFEAGQQLSDCCVRQDDFSMNQEAIKYPFT